MKSKTTKKASISKTVASSQVTGKDVRNYFLTEIALVALEQKGLGNHTTTELEDLLTGLDCIEKYLGYKPFDDEVI